MTIIGFPLNAAGGAPAYSGQDVRLANSALMFGASATRMLGAKSGQRIGTPTTVVSVTGFTYSVAPHSGVLDVQTSATAGPYLYAITEAEQGTIDAAHATLARVDILTIRVDDPQEDATSTPSLEVVYKAGTAGGPAPTPDTTREHVIAHFNVPASGGGDPTVTWKAGYAVAAGGIVPVADDAERDLLSTNYGASQTLYAHHATDGLIVWEKGGSEWAAVGTPADAYNFRWADATARAAQAGMIAGDLGYQTDTGVAYKYTGTEWLPTPLYCSLSKSAHQSIGTTLTEITWDVENSDLGGMHDPSTNTSRVTVPVTGLYEVQTSFYYAATTGTSTAYIRKNGTTGVAGTLFRLDPTANTGSPVKIVTTVVLGAGDYVEVVLSHSTSSYQVNGGSGNHFDPNLTVRLLGPA